MLERQVISCFAYNVCDDFCLQSTGGQVDFAGAQNTDLHLTAGFEQPNGNLSISLNVAIAYNACNEDYEAIVSNLSGCTENSAVHYFWNGVEGDSINSDLAAITHLEVFADNGCSFSAHYNFETMPFEVISCDLLFYNYLSPNGDGDNDIWEIGNVTDTKYQVNNVSFFNRWGALVWQSEVYDNIENAWTGNSSEGQALPDGTYFYVVKVNEQEYSGYVELMR